MKNIKPEDMFLKVVVTAYFPVNGLNIEKREITSDMDMSGTYLNNYFNRFTYQCAGISPIHSIPLGL